MSGQQEVCSYLPDKVPHQHSLYSDMHAGMNLQNWFINQALQKMITLKFATNLQCQ